MVGRSRGCDGFGVRSAAGGNYFRWSGLAVPLLAMRRCVEGGLAGVRTELPGFVVHSALS